MGALAQVLRGFPRSPHPDLLVGMEHFSDAGVYRIDAATAIVLTVDFFPPLVDDPYQFGRIAAANSLSDIYAMGATPLAALNVVGFPDKELPVDVLTEILRGGAERVAAAGAVIVGGHSLRDAEIKYGLSVTGRVDPSRMITNAGARVGDVLVLTKPLGSGTLVTAAKKGEIAESDLSEAIDVMTDLNAGACAAALEVGVHAATDITGFGLIGHAFEMAEASGVSLEIDALAVPFMDNALALAERGIVTGGARTNLAHVGDRLDGGGVSEILLRSLADSQTSGGLLLSVESSRAGRLVAALQSHGTRASAVIGRVTPKSEVSIGVLV